MDFKTDRDINGTVIETFSIDELKEERISKANQLVAILAESAGLDKPYTKFTTESGDVRYYIAADVIEMLMKKIFNK